MTPGSTTFDAASKVWSAPPRQDALPKGKCLGELVLNQLGKLDPEKVVELHYDSGEESTVADVRQLAVSCARSLGRLGVQQGDVVVLFTLLNSQITPVVFGCFIVGAVFNPFETNFNQDDTDYTLENLNPTLILYDSTFESRISSAVQRLNLPKLKHTIPFGVGPSTVGEKLFQDTSDSELFQPPPLGDPDHTPAALLLTSGSTGLPKAIRLSHTHLFHGVFTWWDTDSSSLIYIASPLRWVSQVSAILNPVFLGSVRVATGKEPSAEVCTKVIKDLKVTHFFGVPGLFFSMLSHAKNNDPKCMDSLQLVLCGGEVVSDALTAEVKAVLPNCKLAKAYGMTELAGLIACNDFSQGKKVNGGAIRPGLSVKIVDEELHALGANENGQICIKCQFPYMRYHRNDEANKNAFLKGGWFNTGDFGSMNEEHHLNVLGRYKDNVHSDGCLIVPSKLELIVDTHPAVAVSVVVGVPHRDVEKGQMAAVFVKLTNSTSQKESKELKTDILAFLQGKVSEQEMPVGGVFYVDEFPLTTCGKINKVALRKIATGL